MKTLFISLLTLLSLTVFAQQIDVPVQINLKNGESFNAKHFGQAKCGTNVYIESYILIRGMYMGSLTEIKEYHDIEKIVFSGYTAEPAPSVGNEKAVVIIYKKNGVSVELKEAEVNKSCYSVGDLYNQIVVSVKNPLDGKVNETKVHTKDIQSVVFR